MPEPKGNDLRTIAVRVSPDFHAQLSMVAQIDEISLTDLMMAALEQHVEARREAPDFKAKAQAALEEAEAKMARTRAMLLGAVGSQESATEASEDISPTGRTRRRDGASG